LHAERDRLFPDQLFADLYVHHGRRSVGMTAWQIYDGGVHLTSGAARYQYLDA